ncbi:hypothetical protein HDV57DRAFT_278029 [Trichoderma longibrachiatum]
MKRTKHRMRFFNSDSLPASTRLSSDLLGASRRNTCLGPFDSSFSVRCAFEPTRVSQPTGSAPLVRVCDRVALCHRCAACQSKTGEDVSWSFKRTSDTATVRSTSPLSSCFIDSPIGLGSDDPLYARGWIYYSLARPSTSSRTGAVSVF